MTDAPPPTPDAPGQLLRPFARDPRRWQEERSRVLRRGRVCADTACAGLCEPALVYERTGWGWLAWTVPDDGSLPQRPQQIGILAPKATMTQRLAMRWLTRRPATRITPTPHHHPASLRLATLTVAAISLPTTL
ncbi:hypothetical protein [Streptomyces justiciae]|uniref:Uncharacterized protein n=1 Tax=Streptomyces justiciae TaxID=2780140 RepID=A0ABU3M7K7_9ACTN|nr:hypothetical protein [Streptomyces justiciae]MDT7847479.1 hypothetical protein [Streptomyces justiciae]